MKLEWKRVGPMSEVARAPGGWEFRLLVEDGQAHARIYDAAGDFVARVVDGVAGIEAHRWALEQIANWASDTATKADCDKESGISTVSKPSLGTYNHETGATT